MNNFLLNLFLSVHALVIFAMGLSYGLRILSQRRIIFISAKNELSMNHFLILAVLLLPLIAVVTSQQLKFQPISKTYIAATYKEFDSLPKTHVSEAFVIGNKKTSPSISTGSIKFVVFLLLLASILISLFRVIQDAGVLRAILGKAHVFRKIGRINVAFSNETTVPFSVMVWNSAWIVVPTAFLESPIKTKMSILHEIQHHRQRDTSWLFIFQFLKAFIGMNPAVIFWIRIMSEVQELKVDENLVDQGKVEPREYARCLIEVAETVVTAEGQLVCAAGLAFFPDRHQLKRRIESMFNKKVCSPVTAILIGGLLLSSMTALALTTGKIVGSRTVSMTDAEKMASVAQRSSQFPIVVNDLVLEQLNRYLGTVQGRDFIRNSLQRMEQYRSRIEGKIKSYAYEVPLELLAVPIIESGYRNLPESQNPVKSAGLWQFIRTTAQVYGLRVDNIVDERLDVELSTEAALRYILANQLRFQDWLLAMQAYNMGEENLQQAINKVGSRKVWDLIRAGHEGDKAYIARLEAAILIMKNPESLE